MQCDIYIYVIIYVYICIYIYVYLYFSSLMSAQYELDFFTDCVSGCDYKPR